MRDVKALTANASAAGPAVGVYAARLLDVALPWTSMRAVYRLLGLVRSCGAEAVQAACTRAHELDVVDVTKVSRMLEQARESEPAPEAAKIVELGQPGGSVGPALFAGPGHRGRRDWSTYGVSSVTATGRLADRPSGVVGFD